MANTSFRYKSPFSCPNRVEILQAANSFWSSSVLACSRERKLFLYKKEMPWRSPCTTGRFEASEDSIGETFGTESVVCDQGVALRSGSYSTMPNRRLRRSFENCSTVLNNRVHCFVLFTKCEQPDYLKCERESSA